MITTHTSFSILASTMIRTEKLPWGPRKENQEEKDVLTAAWDIRETEAQGRMIWRSRENYHFQDVVSTGDMWVDGETGRRELRVRGGTCAPLAVKKKIVKNSLRDRRTPCFDHFSTGTDFSKITIYHLGN